MRFSTRWPTVRWRSLATPYSVTTMSVRFRETETTAPGSRMGTMRERVPFFVVDVWARMARPPLEW